MLNLLRSHPGTCSPRGELTEVFQGKGRPPTFNEPLVDYFEKWWRYNLPVLFWQREMVFSKKLWRARRPFITRTRAHVDRVLFNDKLLATGENQNRYKAENIAYTLEEIQAARLLSKNVAGLIFLTDELAKLFSDAIFIAIVRNGFALCEGHIRRGVRPEKIAARYQIGCQKIIHDAENIPNYHIIRFEDILEYPRESLQKIYEFADLDLGMVQKIRLETKKIINEQGQHKLMHNSKEKALVWYELDSFASHFHTGVNENQIARLTSSQKDIIFSVAQSSLEHFSYI